MLMSNITFSQEKAFCLVHMTKQDTVKLISLLYVNALNATFAMGYLLEGGMACGSGVGLVVACEKILQSRMDQDGIKIEERESERGRPSSHPILPSANSLSASSFSALSAAVRLFQQEPVHMLG